MSAKRTSWNEFSSAMASAVICLATGDLSTHCKKYISPAMTQKIFANMRRVGKGCSRVETPLFEGMLVARELENQGDAEEQVDAEEQGNDNNAAEESITAVDDVADQSIQSPTPLTPPQKNLKIYHQHHRRVENLEHDKVAQDLEIIKLKTRVKKLEKANKVKAVKLRRLRKVGTSQRIESSDDTLMKDVSNQGRVIDESDKDERDKLMNEKEEKETKEVRVNPDDAQVEGRQADIYHIDMDHTTKVLSMQEDEPEKQEAVEVITTAKLITEVVADVSETVSAAAVVQADVPIASVNAAAVVTTAPPVKTPTGTNSKNKGKGIMVEEPKLMKKKQQVELDEAYTRKLQEELNQDIDWETEAQARRNMMVNLKNTTGLTLDYFKGMSYDDIHPIFETKFNANMEFLLKSKEQLEEEESRAIHLEIVPDEDDDVYTEATPLARKVPVVDYQIIHVNIKPRYKIIRANDTHHLYRSFITMLKNFDRDDLETLWMIVKERFSTSKPNNFSDEYLLSTLKTMFGRPDGQDNVWKDQRSVHGQALVKS
nr:hypothetical protein [Tanacetum cinerariifolium]